MRQASAVADAKDNPPVGAGRPLAEGPPGRIHSACRPTVGRRPSCRWKSAFQGAARQVSAFADASDVPRSAQADRRPKAFVPMEIGLPRRYAPGVGLRRRKRQSSGRRRPTAGRRPPQAEFIRRAGRPRAKGLRADGNRPLQALRAKCRPPPTQATFLGRRRPTVGRRPSCRLKSAFQGAARQASAFADASDVPRSAQADRWPKAPPGRIHSACRPTVGRRPPQATFIRHAGHPAGIARA